MKGIFFSEDGYFRSGWKILRVMLFVLLIFISCSLLIGSIIGRNPLSKYLMPICLILSTYLSIKFIEKRKLNEIGVNKLNIKSVKEFMIGFSISFISCVLIFVGLIFTEEVSLEKINVSYEIGLTGLLYWLFVAFGEEVFFRGYIISTLPKKYSFWLKSAISAILFSVTHMINPSYNSLIIFLYAFFIGIYLGYMYKITEAIWMSIGFHFSWNYFQSLFGIPDEGIWVNSITGAVICLNILLLSLYYKRISRNQSKEFRI